MRIVLLFKRDMQNYEMLKINCRILKQVQSLMRK